MAQEHLDMPGTNYGQQPHVSVNSFETKKKTKKSSWVSLHVSSTILYYSLFILTTKSRQVPFT
jgi:hypothetical protein